MKKGISIWMFLCTCILLIASGCKHSGACTGGACASTVPGAPMAPAVGSAALAPAVGSGTQTVSSADHGTNNLSSSDGVREGSKRASNGTIVPNQPTVAAAKLTIGLYGNTLKVTVPAWPTLGFTGDLTSSLVYYWGWDQQGWAAMPGTVSDKTIQYQLSDASPGLCGNGYGTATGVGPISFDLMNDPIILTNNLAVQTDLAQPMKKHLCIK